MKNAFCILLLFVLSGNVYAEFDTSSIHFGAGMLRASYAEKQSSLTPTSELQSVTPAFSGSLSSIVLVIGYEKYLDADFSVFGKGYLPALGTQADGLFRASGGANWYFYGLSSPGDFSGGNESVEFSPIFSIWLGVQTGVSFLSYTTKTARKSDTLLDIGIVSGLRYDISSRYAVRTELGISRGFGVLTNATLIEATVGASYNFGQ